MEARVAAKNALMNVLEAAPGERIVIVCDTPLEEVGLAFAEGALDMSMWTRLVKLEAHDNVRKEVPEHLREIFISQKPDIFINLLRGHSEETPFRIEVIQMETRNRVRLGHCPGVTLEMLTKGALALDSEGYKTMQNFGSCLSRVLDGVTKIHITNKSGTDLTMNVKGRSFITDTKIDWHSVKWMNLPVGEVFCAPIESSLEGTLVCDMAVGGIGKLKSPVTLTVKKGKVTKMVSDDKASLKRIKKALKVDEWANVVGEFAFGINPSARYSDEFLEAEKKTKTCHIAFGNNRDFPGGKNDSHNHMDFMMNEPTVTITTADGDDRVILKKGLFKI